jgi:hypothetical protein
LQTFDDKESVLGARVRDKEKEKEDGECVSGFVGRLKHYRAWQALVSGQPWKRKPTQKPWALYLDQSNKPARPVLLYEDGLLIVPNVVDASLRGLIAACGMLFWWKLAGYESIQGRVQHRNGSYV